MARKKKRVVCPEICICAAWKTEEGIIIRGHRHCDCGRSILARGLTIDKSSDAQGFITSRNRFVTRTEGRRLQLSAKIPSQDSEGYKGNTLFSEDLYSDFGEYKVPLKFVEA